jgi:nanoRNase/pAp phosphatase (c-di-AMP/oligoRNAs hydrolase)
MVTAETRRRFAELATLVTEGGEGRWLVLTHDNPDPDALASAAILARLLRQGFHQRVTAAYGGLIGRAENREMVRQLHLDFSHLRHLSWKRYARFALVDAQPRTGNHQLPDDRTPDLVFDHHPPRKATQSARFADIRTDYGATATLVTEYLHAADLEPTKNLATAVVYAIRSETRDFHREAAAPDKTLYDALLPRSDKRALAKIQAAPLPVSYFRHLHTALERLETVGRLVITHLGSVDQPDIVPEVADLLLRTEGKTWSLATGRFQDRIYLSVRTTNPRAEAGHLMRRIVGRKGKGGGHGTTAGGWVPITAGWAEDPAALQRQLARRLARALRQNPDRIAPLLAPEGTPAAAG